MAAIVIEDITNLSLSIHEENSCGVRDAVESLFKLYIVCYNMKRKRKSKRKKENNTFNIKAMLLRLFFFVLYI